MSVVNATPPDGLRDRNLTRLVACEAPAECLAARRGRTLVSRREVELVSGLSVALRLPIVLADGSVLNRPQSKYHWTEPAKVAITETGQQLLCG